MFLKSLPLTNCLIASLPTREKKCLTALCTVTHWAVGDSICKAQDKITHVHFPVSGFISQLTVVDNHSPLEVGLIGNEGMFGISVVLGVNTAPLQCVVQGAGTALSIPVKKFELLLLDSPGLAILLRRYIYVLLQQLTLAGTCLHFHTIESRLARWLLMTQDRAHQDELYLTHSFLAQMLCVRRSGVTIAAQSLQSQRLIDYVRGTINIIDRQGLERASCHCYHSMIGIYNQILK